jgi:hypothetical protein
MKALPILETPRRRRRLRAIFRLDNLLESVVKSNMKLKRKAQIKVEAISAWRIRQLLKIKSKIVKESMSITTSTTTKFAMRNWSTIITLFLETVRTQGLAHYKREFRS